MYPCGHILPSDVDALGGHAVLIMNLIAIHPFRERIEYLLQHPELARIPVLNAVGRTSNPNCIGTAFFIAGVGTIKYPYHGYDQELNPYFTDEGDDVMRMFAQSTKRRVPGAFIFSFSARDDDWHVGIYLGSIPGAHVAFAQHGHGLDFGPESISGNFHNPSYHIPPTLSQTENLLGE